MAHPKLSVILPVFNLAPWLPEALESLRAQTFADWECVAVDDGSTDDVSGEMLDATVRADVRFRVVHQPNAGVSAARNRALDAVRGEYVGFFDGDDVMLPGWLAEFMRIAAASDADLVRLRLTFWEDGVPRPAGRSPLPWRFVPHARASREELLLSMFGEILRVGSVWCSVVRRELACSERFPVGLSMKEDALYSCRLLLRVRSIAQGACADYLYRQRQGSVMHQHHSASVSQRLYREIGTLWAEMERREVSEPLHRHLADSLKAFCWCELLDWVWMCESRSQSEREMMRCALREVWQNRFWRLGRTPERKYLPVYGLLIGVGSVFPFRVFCHLLAIWRSLRFRVSNGFRSRVSITDEGST